MLFNGVVVVCLFVVVVVVFNCHHLAGESMAHY